MTLLCFSTVVPILTPSQQSHSVIRRPRIRMQTESPQCLQRQGLLRPFLDFVQGVRRAAGLADSDAAA